MKNECTNKFMMMFSKCFGASSYWALNLHSHKHTLIYNKYISFLLGLLKFKTATNLKLSLLSYLLRVLAITDLKKQGSLVSAVWSSWHLVCVLFRLHNKDTNKSSDF